MYPVRLIAGLGTAALGYWMVKNRTNARMQLGAIQADAFVRDTNYDIMRSQYGEWSGTGLDEYVPQIERAKAFGPWGLFYNLNIMKAIAMTKISEFFGNPFTYLGLAGLAVAMPKTLKTALVGTGRVLSGAFKKVFGGGRGVAMGSKAGGAITRGLSGLLGGVMRFAMSGPGLLLGAAGLLLHLQFFKTQTGQAQRELLEPEFDYPS